MDKNKIHGFMDNLNLLLIGAIIGCIIGACFMSNYHTGKGKKAEKKIEAYERYYTCVETLLDSLDGTRNLDLMDTDLETDYGVDYLEAKSKVDELITKQSMKTTEDYIGVILIIFLCSILAIAISATIIVSSLKIEQYE